jgi:hypothetical protein
MGQRLEPLAPSAELASLHAAWSAPFLADPRDEAASEARAAQTREVARLLLASPLRTRVGGLTVFTAGWSRERADAARAAGEAGSPAWFAALGAHEHATLTSDGGAADRTRWCECEAEFRASEWVRYEYWTERGMERHGYVHSECRRLLQTG